MCIAIAFSRVRSRVYSLVGVHCNLAKVLVVDYRFPNWISSHGRSVRSIAFCQIYFRVFSLPGAHCIQSGGVSGRFTVAFRYTWFDQDLEYFILFYLINVFLPGDDAF